MPGYDMGGPGYRGQSARAGMGGRSPSRQGGFGMMPPGGGMGGGAPQFGFGGPTQMPNYPAVNQSDPHPQLQALMGDWANMGNEWSNFRGELAAGKDRDAVNAMNRQRSLTSGVASEVGSNALQRLGSGSGVAEKLRGRALMSGASDASSLNADLAAGSRQAQLQALSGQTGALAGKQGAGQALAGNQLQAQDAAMRQAQMTRGWQEFDANRQDRNQQQMFQNNYQMMQYANRANPTYRG